MKELGGTYSKAGSKWGSHVVVDTSGLGPIVTGDPLHALLTKCCCLDPSDIEGGKMRARHKVQGLQPLSTQARTRALLLTLQRLCLTCSRIDWSAFTQLA